MIENYAGVLEKFHISRTAAKVYLALLELGKSGADGIAKKAGTYKANVYDSLGKLIEIGLVTYVIEGKKKLYIPTDPNKLLDAADESKEKAIENCELLKKDLEKIIPYLSEKYSRIKDKEIFEIYLGKKGYRAMIREILREKPKQWKGFGNIQVQEFFPNEFERWFRNINMMLFSTPSEIVKKRLKEAKKTAKIKIIWVPEDIQMQVVWTLFGNNLLILLYEPEIIAIRIKSSQVVKTFSDQFDYLWKKHSRT